MDWCSAVRTALAAAREYAAACNEDELFDREREDIFAAACLAAYEEEARGASPLTVQGAAIHAAVSHLRDRIETLRREMPAGLAA